jgi:hypothetical protein
MWQQISERLTPTTIRVLGISGGNVNMILEVAILNIRPGDSADFEQALTEAQAIIAARAWCGWGPTPDFEADKRSETDVRPAAAGGMAE